MTAPSPLSDRAFWPRDAITWLDTIDSTSRELARRAAASPDLDRVWLAAKHQTEGRGRLNRPWASEPGGLYASLLMRCPIPPVRAPEAGFVAGLALHEAVARLIAQTALGYPALAYPALWLKWPNDLMAGNAKLAGVLVEAVADHGSADHPSPGSRLIIGFGLNLTTHPDLPDRAISDLSACFDCVISPEQALAELAACFGSAFTAWLSPEGFGAIRSAWLARGPAPRTAVTVTLAAPNPPTHADGPAQTRSGRFIGLDANGALRLELAHGQHTTITAGEAAFATPSTTG